MEIGDRVIVNGSFWGMYFYESRAIVVNLDIKHLGYIGVEFDTYIGGHTCDGKGRKGYCLNINEEMIKKEGTMKERIEELEKELAALKAQLKYEPKYGTYFINGNGNIVQATKECVVYDYVNSGRAFDTKEKAEKARDIMVKHDIILKYVIDHAPDYEPDWTNPNEYKWFVEYKCEHRKYIADWWSNYRPVGLVFMPKSVAEKLADDLNNNRIEGM